MTATLKASINLSRSLKALGISCVGLLLAVGLCGLDQHLYPNAEFGGSNFALIGAVLGVLSALLLVVSVLVLLVDLIAQAFKK